MICVAKGQFAVINGELLKGFRTRVVGATQQQFSSLTGLSVPSIQSIEKTSKYRMRESRLLTVAERLGLSLSALEEHFGASAKPISAEVVNSPWVSIVRQKIRGEGGAGDRFEPVALTSIPYFDFRIPAGGWSESCDGCSKEDADGSIEVPIDTPSDAFALKIRGDSMSPEFPDGSIVVFVPILSGDKGRHFASGKPYYVQHSDGLCTFKIVVYEAEKQRYRLDSINAKYKPIYLTQREVGSFSKAVKMVRIL